MPADIDRSVLDRGAWAALEGAYDALVAGGLPCGAALADADGTVIVSGRNHVYDAATGTDVLEATPLAHAELNVLAKIAHTRDLSNDTLWSTQQPCSMCSAALAFCGVRSIRFLAADPAFAATTDFRGGEVNDPTIERPELTAWAILANALFLQPSVARNDTARLARNEAIEPETVIAARSLVDWPRGNGLEELVQATWVQLMDLAAKRRERLASRS